MTYEVVTDNYAAEDYDVNCDDAVKVRVDNDKEFLLSLAKIDAIRVLERADSC
ncbi:UNVERIFIED_CONTAM: hypothetical protein Cloal_4175 [Acetivibrio alkalicellulosi]